MIVFHWLRLYWDWAGSNIGAAPACGLLAILFAVCCQKPISRWWHRHFGVRNEIREVRKIAEASQRISADLFEHHTGQAHPDAPPARED